MPSVCIRSLAFWAAFAAMAASAAEPTPAAVALVGATRQADATILIDDRPVRLPGFRNVVDLEVGETLFSPPRPQDQEDFSGLTDGLPDRIEAVVVDPIGGNAIRIGGKEIREGDVIVHGGAGGADGTRQEAKLVVREIYETHIVVVAPDGSVQTVATTKHWSEHGGTDVIVGSGVMIDESGLILAVLPRESDEARLCAFTLYGRLDLELVTKDSIHGIALLRVRPPPALRARFPHVGLAKDIPAPGGTFHAVFFDAGEASRQPGVIHTTARVSAVDNGWLLMRGIRCPVGLMLFDAAGNLNGIALRRENASPGIVSALHPSQIPALRERVPGSTLAATPRWEDVMVAIARPVVFGRSVASDSR